MSEAGLVTKTVFKGDRTYVNTATLCDDVWRLARTQNTKFDGAMEFKIQKLMRRRPCYFFSSTSKAPANSVGHFRFFRGAEEVFVFLTESDEPITAREAYDVSALISGARVEGPRASYTGPALLSPMETLTALAAHLHKVAVPPLHGKAWFLTQLNLRRPLEQKDSEELKVEIEKVVLGTLSRTIITAPDGNLGAVLFMLGEA